MYETLAVVDEQSMGFKPLLCNSVKMYLIPEEIIRGNWLDMNNDFQWKEIHLNLPGSGAYDPNPDWISKQREDESLASDYVCFMEDQRLTGYSLERI